MVSPHDHISICICTYKRPQLLSRLLTEIQNQVTEDLFTYSIVVVDNDYAQSAKNVVLSFKRKSFVEIDYYNEPEQNISLARNKAVENAKGNFVALIDDDEFPVNDWLLNLYKTCSEYGVDGVLGPVKPFYDKETPKWIIKGNLFKRKCHKTGTVLHWSQTRTGNVLLNTDVFKGENNRFDPAFGRTGGEDYEFFKNIIGNGRTVVWCDEAPVYEYVLPRRWNKTYILKRYLRMGGSTGEVVREGPLRGYGYLIKSFAALILYTLLIPFSLLLGPHVYMKWLMKVAYHFGCLSAFCGWVVVKYIDY